MTSLQLALSDQTRENALSNACQLEQIRAYVDRPIYPGLRGRVRYHSTYWFGVCSQNLTLSHGTEVVVTGRDGNTLIVEPILA